jgi:hypothetical protein
MLKFREIGTYKNAVNIGYLTADVVLKNGNVVTYDLAKKKAALPKTGKESGLAIVINTIDKPEISEPNAFTIEIGENPRIFTLESLKDRVIDMDMDQVTGTYADIKEGDFLVADTTGKLKVVKAASGVTDYKEYLKVIEKTTYNAEGLAAVVVIA